MEQADILRDRGALNKKWYEAGVYGALTLPRQFDAKLPETGGTEYLFCDGSTEVSTTLRDIIAAARRMAGALHRLGVRRGDVVAGQMPTCLETLVLYHAIWRAGGVILPIVHLYGPVETGFILRQSRARVYVARERWKKIDYVERIGQCGVLPDLRHIVIHGDADAATAQRIRTVLPDALMWDVLASHAHDDCPDPQQSPDEVCLLLYTSGTTSEPKGVQHTHNTLLAEWRISGYPNDGTNLCCFPAGHMAGINFLMRPCMDGIRSVFMDHWQPELAASLIEKHHVRQSGGTPYFLISLLQGAAKSGHSLASLEFFAMGGAGVTPEHVRLAEENGFKAGRSYGLTEHCSVSEALPWMPAEKRAHTDGKVIEYSEVRIIDDDGQPLPVGTPGEVATRGPEMFIGYTNTELNTACFIPGGWFRTGDIGILDDENYLTITDRKKDIIIRGGENISSKEIEDVMATHPAIAEVAVAAMPDEVYGEKVCVFAILRTGTTLKLADVAEHFRIAGATRQKTPEGLVILADFPRTASGKIKKFELRAALQRGEYRLEKRP